MPKKFKGENTKSSMARARRSEQVAEEKAAKEKAIDDAYWKDDDKLINKKLQRKEDKEKKRLEDLERKKEKKALEEQEEKSFVIQAPPIKLSAFEIQKQREANSLADKSSNNECRRTHLSNPLVENLNRLDSEDTISASGLDAAVAALSVSIEPSSAVDKHPEKRMAAAFRAYEKQRMPPLKKEFPSMRLSQLNQMLRKEWRKSPDNPLNKNNES